MGDAVSAHRERRTLNGTLAKRHGENAALTRQPARRAGGASFATHGPNDMTVHDFVMATWPEDATHPLAQRFRRTLRILAIAMQRVK